MIHKQKSTLCLPFFGITISSALMPLSRFRDNGFINNGVAEERKPSVLEMLRREDLAKEKELPEFPGAGTKAKKPDERSLS